jgi:siroheme synthase-like protein
MLPLFLNLTGRRVVLIGDGPVAAAKRELLVAAGADVLDVPAASFDARQLDDAWLVVTAADGVVNAAVARAAEERRVFVNAADDPTHASAYLSGVVRRDGVTIAISTEGSAPGLTGLLREALDVVLPHDVGEWVDEARRQRTGWRRDGVPFESRRPLLLDALNRLYDRSEDSKCAERDRAKVPTEGM